MKIEYQQKSPAILKIAFRLDRRKKRGLNEYQEIVGEDGEPVNDEFQGNFNVQHAQNFRLDLIRPRSGVGLKPAGGSGRYRLIGQKIMVLPE